MELEQVKKDFDNGVMICRGTWARVLEAALDMEDTLDEFATDRMSGDDASKYVNTVAFDCLERVDKL